MKVSIAIPTHNRAAELCQTLRTLSQIDTSSVDDYEVLVVGNNCTDDTAEIARRFRPKFGEGLRYVEEPQQGLSHARNRAVAESRYEIIAFLDDDVDVDPNWLKALVKAYQEENCAAVGGKAYLIFPGGRPEWLSPQEDGKLSRVDLGPITRPAKPDELFGVNLSFRRSWLERVGLFRTDLGRVGSRLAGGEELDMLERIAHGGGRIWYEPTAVVGHRVAPGRLKRRWFWSRCFWGQNSFAELNCPEKLWYSLVRISWHLIRTSLMSFRTLCYPGLKSKEFFLCSNRLASHCGAWFVIARRICRRKIGLFAREGRTEHVSQ
jgi:glucosyl-dolichyl phosphate glucuronosyltransferase